MEALPPELCELLALELDPASACKLNYRDMEWSLCVNSKPAVSSLYLAACIEMFVWNCSLISAIRDAFIILFDRFARRLAGLNLLHRVSPDMMLSLGCFNRCVPRWAYNQIWAILVDAIDWDNVEVIRAFWVGRIHVLLQGSRDIIDDLLFRAARNKNLKMMRRYQVVLLDFVVSCKRLRLNWTPTREELRYVADLFAAPESFHGVLLEDWVPSAWRNRFYSDRDLYEPSAHNQDALGLAATAGQDVLTYLDRMLKNPRSDVVRGMKKCLCVALERPDIEACWQLLSDPRLPNTIRSSEFLPTLLGVARRDLTFLIRILKHQRFLALEGSARVLLERAALGYLTNNTLVREEIKEQPFLPSMGSTPTVVNGEAFNNVNAIKKSSVDGKNDFTVLSRFLWIRDHVFSSQNLSAVDLHNLLSVSISNISARKHESSQWESIAESLIMKLTKGKIAEMDRNLKHKLNSAMLGKVLSLCLERRWDKITLEMINHPIQRLYVTKNHIFAAISTQDKDIVRGVISSMRECSTTLMKLVIDKERKPLFVDDFGPDMKLHTDIQLVCFERFWVSAARECGFFDLHNPFSARFWDSLEDDCFCDGFYRRWTKKNDLCRRVRIHVMMILCPCLKCQKEETNLHFNINALKFIIYIAYNH
ncbi:hypothetical protein BC829DRAFT_388399 [Chytridium lagenaria]|nr:hypothetical protein BC829DRAFT_388399 [Chytridium lagenaria]